MTFSEAKAIIRSNLEDAGVTFYSLDDISDTIQDAYDDIAFQSKCLINKTSVSFRTSPYYDFSLYVSDFLSVVAIFNNNTNRFLQDNLSRRDLFKLRSNWELWNGPPEWWCPSDIRMNILIPYYNSVPAQPMDLFYAAQAPTLQNASDVILLAPDALHLLEWYGTADMLEQAEEYGKANSFWKLYIEKLDCYKEDCQNAARANVMTLI